MKNGYICTNSADVKRAINTICSNKSRDIRQNGNKSLYARSEQNKKWENLLKGITSIHDNARNKNCEN